MPCSRLPMKGGSQQGSSSSTNRYTGCVDNNHNPIPTNTHTTDRPTDTPTATTHESLAHDNMYIYLCVLGQHNHHYIQSEAMPPPAAVVKPVPPFHHHHMMVVCVE
jgi:hypothetical protein